ncbi:MAG: hypothetical protein JWO38_1087 [Gemmataceae bacterium]|nr:hypothetical protein [Gemmataceae bacterium]
MDGQASRRRYRLLGRDGEFYECEQPGTLGGNSRECIYGRLDCPAALAALAGGNVYAQHRVFFADEAAAIAAGYRPCGRCLRARYTLWTRGGVPNTAEYPWLFLPPSELSSHCE